MRQRFFYIYGGFLVVLVSVLGSLILSEWLHLIPCELCWYQRMLMFPLLIIFIVGLWKKDHHLPYFVLPFSILGSLVALYHIALQNNWFNVTRDCGQLISCAAKQLEFLGFITIPVMSLAAFIVITIVMILSLKRSK